MTIRSYSDFKFENHPSIIEASRIIIAEGSAVYRVVLRNTGAALSWMARQSMSPTRRI